MTTRKLFLSFDEVTRWLIYYLVEMTLKEIAECWVTVIGFN